MEPVPELEVTPSRPRRAILERTTMRSRMIPRMVRALLACFLIVACGIPDRSPADMVKAYEDAVSAKNPGDARSLLTEKQAKDASQLFLDVLAEEHNRGEEGILSEKRSTKTVGDTSTVTAIYELRDRVRKTYEWELVRENGRWRINSWSVEAAAGPVDASIP